MPVWHTVRHQARDPRRSAIQRREISHARAKPLLDQLHRWLEQRLKTPFAQSDIAASIRYVLSRWCALTRYVDDGLIEVDNPSTEGRSWQAELPVRKCQFWRGPGPQRSTRSSAAPSLTALIRRSVSDKFRNPDLDPVLSADQEKGTSRLGCVGVASGATLILRCRSYNFQFFPQM
jgi:hypothetical protein